jgi:hypothetical protein
MGRMTLLHAVTAGTGTPERTSPPRRPSRAHKSPNGWITKSQITKSPDHRIARSQTRQITKSICTAICNRQFLTCRKNASQRSTSGWSGPPVWRYEAAHRIAISRSAASVAGADPVAWRR